MKRFFKIFLPLAPRVLLPQLLSAIVSQSFQGMELVGFLILLLCVAIPFLYLRKVVRNPCPGSSFPLLACFYFGLFFMSTIPGTTDWNLRMLGNLAAITASAIWAMKEQKYIRDTLAQLQEQDRKDALKCLEHFKTARNRQYFIISHIDADSVLEELDMQEEKDNGRVFQLPDGRLLVVLKKPLKQEDFNYLLEGLRSYSQDADDVVGYIDKAGSQSPFDFSLLEGARPVLPLNL